MAIGREENDRIIMEEKLKNLKLKKEKDFPVDTFKHLKKYIDTKLMGDAYQYYESKIQKYKIEKGLLGVKMNHAFVALGFEMVNVVIKDCDDVIQYPKEYPNQFIPYCLKGIGYLWRCDEQSAVTTWYAAYNLKSINSEQRTILMHLLNNPNARTWLFGQKFQVKTVISLVIDYHIDLEPNKLFVDDELQRAYMELRQHNNEVAVRHFDHIIRADHHNLYAIQGRGVANCMNGSWNQAIDDLNHLFRTCNLFNKAKKYRAIAYAGLDQISYGTTELDACFTEDPKDYEIGFQLAFFHIKRGVYILAKEVYDQIPLSAFKDEQINYYAIVLYLTGEFSKAFSILTKHQTSSSPYDFYSRILVLTGLNTPEMIYWNSYFLTKTAPYFFSFKLAAEMMADKSLLSESILQYQQALEENPNDIETLYHLTLSLLMRKDFNSAITYFNKILEEFQGLIDHSIATTQIISNFNKCYLDRDIIQSALNDAYFAARLITDIRKSIKSYPRDSLIKSKIKQIEFPPNFQVPVFKITSEIDQMIKIANSIGKTCVNNFCYNQRVTRAFGFCVMYLVNQFKRATKLSWNDVLEDLILIITYADLRNCIELNDYSVKSFYLKSTTYYIWKGFQKSNRFGYVLPKLFKIIKRAFENDDNEYSFPLSTMIPLENIEDIYKISQCDFLHCDFWEYKGHELPMPSIVYRNIGVYGFELFIRCSFEAQQDNSYQKDIVEAFDRMQSMTNKHSMIDALADFMTLVFIFHPTSHYSPEIAQIVMHAFLIANFDLDIGLFETEKQEIFIDQMLEPNPQAIAKKLLEDIQKMQKEPSTNEFCLDFWAELPSVADMLSLYLANGATPYDIVLEPKEIPLD